MPQEIKISVIVPTKDEAENIAECLESLADFSEVFVVDSQSSDRTTEIAKSYGANVIQFHYNGEWPKKKNWAISNLPLRNEWILIIDADERMTPELRDEMSEAIEVSDISGYYIRWKFIFLGKWMRHSWNHGWMVRLFRRSSGKYEDLGMRSEGGWDNEVHEHLIVNGRVGRLKSYLLHDSEKTLESWIAKQNDFSTWNAEKRRQQRDETLISALRFIGSTDPLKRRRLLKAVFIRLPAKPMLLFFYLYVIRLGLLDGVAGLYFCALRASHELNICAKMHEARIINR